MNTIDNNFSEHHGDDCGPATTPRARRRPARIGMLATGLAAVGAATALASGSAAAAPAAAPVKAQGAAHVVKHAKANAAGDVQGSGVIELKDYASGDVGTDGSLTNLGSQVGTGDQWQYFTPNGSLYEHGSSPAGDDYQSFVQMSDGKALETVTRVDNAKHIYSTMQQDIATPGLTTPSSTPTITSSPAQVQQALQSGAVTQLGTTTVNGTPAIALSTTNPSNGFNTVLYVDAQSDQPLQLVNDASHSEDPSIQHIVAVFDWYPATAANIAKAKTVSIPAGYKKVTPSTPSSAK